MKSNLSRKYKDLGRGAKGYIKRVVVFLILYTVLSLLQPIVSQWLYHANFIITDKYLAYLIYPILIVFTFFRWEKIKGLPKYKNKGKHTLIFFIISIVILLFPLNLILKVVSENSSLMHVAHFTIFFLSYLFLFLAVFGLKFFNYFFKEILLVCGVFVGFVVLELIVQQCWFYFSDVIIKGLKIILPPITSDLSFAETGYNVDLKDFSINIGPVCAGFYSLATFIFLFLASLFLLGSGKKIKYIWAFISLFLGLVVVFVLNIVRIVIIILVGGYILQDLAINLFHEYLSAVFLIGIFLLYLYWVIPRLVVRSA